MTTLSLTDLATITGGAAATGRLSQPLTVRLDGREHGAERQQAARRERHLVLNDSQLCGFPMPK